MDEYKNEMFLVVAVVIGMILLIGYCKQPAKVKPLGGLQTAPPAAPMYH